MSKIVAQTPYSDMPPETSMRWSKLQLNANVRGMVEFLLPTGR